MERLTKRNADGVVTLAKGCHDGCKYLTCSMEEGYSCEHQCEADIVCKLADYEDKQEQGVLVELKAKVGDDIFKVINGTISRLKITRIEITIYGIEYFVWGYTLTNEGCGVTWFLTEAEAESALAKMGGSHEDTY